jgi:tRNA (mo5U34)-methyltransferase
MPPTSVISASWRPPSRESWLKRGGGPDDDRCRRVARKVAAIKFWFHTIELPHGVTTPGAGDPNYQRGASEIYFGMGIQGRSVLDVGAWDGFFSFDAERRGAADVLAVDDLAWRPNGPGDKTAFELARNALGSSVRDRQIDLPDVTVEEVGQFDVVLYNGIFYHVLDPIHQLIEMAKIARHMLTIETWIDNLDAPRGVMNFFPATQPPLGSPRGYPRSGWGPTHS